MTLLARKVLKISRSTFFGTPGIEVPLHLYVESNKASVLPLCTSFI